MIANLTSEEFDIERELTQLHMALVSYGVVPEIDALVANIAFHYNQIAKGKTQAEKELTESAARHKRLYDFIFKKMQKVHDCYSCSPELDKPKPNATVILCNTCGNIYLYAEDGIERTELETPLHYYFHQEV